MKHKAFAARDSRLGVYHPPFFMLHVGQALRAWEELCNDGKSPMSKYASEFQLFEVGSFDDDTGLFEPIQPHQIATGSDYRKKIGEPVMRDVSAQDGFVL